MSIGAPPTSSTTSFSSASAGDRRLRSSSSARRLPLANRRRRPTSRLPVSDRRHAGICQREGLQRIRGPEQTRRLECMAHVRNLASCTRACFGQADCAEVLAGKELDFSFWPFATYCAAARPRSLCEQSGHGIVASRHQFMGTRPRGRWWPISRSVRIEMDSVRRCGRRGFSRASPRQAWPARGSPPAHAPAAG
jgi:hypothetical protein